MSEPALDHTVIATLRDLNQPGEPDVVDEVLTLFRDGAARRIAAIAGAIERGDADALRRAAHEFKGASAAIGANALHRCCRELEDLGKAGTLAACAPLLSAMHREYDRVASEIDRLLRT